MANIQTRVLRGQASEGMILPAEVDGRPIPVVVADEMVDSVME